MLTLAWATDIHLDSARKRPGNYEKFIDSLNEVRPSYLLITGDISTNIDFVEEISRLHQNVRTNRIFFVLGNHDRWYGSFEYAKEKAQELNTWDMVYLPEEGPMLIAPDTVLLGVDGWYDARAGELNSRLIMNDWDRIVEYTTRDTFYRIVDLSRRIADEETTLLERHLQKALEMNVKNILIATHVPPFEDAVVAKAADEHARTEMLLPWYMNQRMGEVLLRIACENPTREFTVLSGHVHANVSIQKAPNLLFKASLATYGRPCIAEVIELGDEGNKDGRAAADSIGVNGNHDR